MECIRQGEVSFPRTPGEPDSVRAWRPWVLEDEDATLRMWYTGSDGTTSTILTAKRPPGGGWERLGVAIDAGFAGDSDSYGAESPCVVKTPGGYLMVYGGSDGEISRLHMATSEDSHRWDTQGTIMQRGPEDEGGANHPCLLMTGEGGGCSTRGIRARAGSAVGAGRGRLADGSLVGSGRGDP